MTVLHTLKQHLSQTFQSIKPSQKEDIEEVSVEKDESVKQTIKTNLLPNTTQWGEGFSTTTFIDPSTQLLTSTTAGIDPIPDSTT
ncbi:MAG: hypothetical protein Q3961_03370, partial [Bifidobacteriaceae bacterium]|nr:hypothetical protein [Bifidobacteriaceae bacterium]